jgi:hypothetical protein
MMVCGRPPDSPAGRDRRGGRPAARRGSAIAPSISPSALRERSSRTDPAGVSSTRPVVRAKSTSQAHAPGHESHARAATATYGDALPPARNATPPLRRRNSGAAATPPKHPRWTDVDFSAIPVPAEQPRRASARPGQIRMRRDSRGRYDDVRGSYLEFVTLAPTTGVRWATFSIRSTPGSRVKSRIEPARSPSKPSGQSETTRP